MTRSFYALGFDSTPLDPSSSPFEAWVADTIPDAQMTRLNLPAAMDALKTELRRMLTEH